MRNRERKIMKNKILIGIILLGQAALADVPNLQIARDALNIHRENQRYAEAEYRRAKRNYLESNRLLSSSQRTVQLMEKLEEQSRLTALSSSESHTRIGATYQHEPRLAETGIRRVK
jgi:hypothetical protein